MANLFILNYHSIVPHWGFDVACRTLDFEFAFLKKYYNVVPLGEICNLLQGGTSPRRTTVAVTFDDGYADAFVYAIPLCKKHGIRATMFPITSRVNNEESVRWTLEDYWNGRIPYGYLYKTRRMDDCNYDFLESGFSASFMTTAELREAAKVVDIGSHGSIHARVFNEEKIVDLFDGTNGNCSNIYAYEERPLRGFPLFPDQNNLAVRRGFLRPEVKDFVRSINDKYFLRRNWKKMLCADLNIRFSTFLTFETEQERLLRINEELSASKQFLERITGQKTRYFAYPYGHHDPILEKVVGDHFEAAFTTDIDIVRMHNKLNLIPRAKVHRDILSFMSRVIKFSRRK
jgi:peptidoglycan/xylan/chitin deacetylase (PgdA/CDA1 family)